MKELLLGGLVGLLVGIAQVRLQLHHRRRVKAAVPGRDVPLLRALLLALGSGAALSALMMWLAVIDVDTVSVPDMNLGTLAGGVLFGLTLGAGGLAPCTSGTLLGAGPTWEGLCAVLGCLAGCLCLPVAQRLFRPVQAMASLGAFTWFRVTLDKGYLFPGGFLGQGLLGLALMVLALCIPRPAPPASALAPEPVPDASPEPEAVQQDAVVVTLPGEEPVVVDTAQDPPEDNG